LSPFGYLILDCIGEVGNGVTEVLYLVLYGLCSADLSGLAVRVPADEIGVEQLVDNLGLALAEGFLQEAAHLVLVLLRRHNPIFSFPYGGFLRVVMMPLGYSQHVWV
jgi:hypothetical protein